MGIKKLKAEFEKLKYIEEKLEYLNFDEHLGCYVEKNNGMPVGLAAWVNGALYGFNQAAKAQAVPKWISVEDGLPSDGQNIIAFDAIKHCVFKDGEFLQGYFEPDTGHEYTEPVDVTHWIAIEAQEQKV
ncbi:MAG: DUF551 domain-containing protein [Acinetobacter johnsonii]